MSERGHVPARLLTSIHNGHPAPGHRHVGGGCQPASPGTDHDHVIVAALVHPDHPRRIITIVPGVRGLPGKGESPGAAAVSLQDGRFGRCRLDALEGGDGHPSPSFHQSTVSRIDE